MATSGSFDFLLDRDQIVIDALKKIGAIEAGEAPAAEEISDGARQLNTMVKAWHAKGLHLWKLREGVLFLEKGKNTYTLGLESPDHATEETDAVKTALSVAGAATDTTIEVESIAGIAANDEIGVVLDDGTFHWTTVSGAPAGSTVTLAVALPSAAAAGKKVHSYTADLVRPLRVIESRRRDETADQDIPIIMFSRQEYFDTPNKSTESLTTEVYYDPQTTLINGARHGRIHLWPTPTDIDSTLRFTCALPIEDFDTATDSPDLPVEWSDALVFNLAVRLCPEYGVPTQDRVWLKTEAAEFLDDVMMWDTEPESIYFAPDLTVGGWG